MRPSFIPEYCHLGPGCQQAIWGSGQESGRPDTLVTMAKGLRDRRISLSCVHLYRGKHRTWELRRIILSLHNLWSLFLYSLEVARFTWMSVVFARSSRSFSNWRVPRFVRSWGTCQHRANRLLCMRMARFQPPSTFRIMKTYARYRG